MILLDANILIRMADKEGAQYAATIAAVFQCRKVDTLAIVPQSLYEFCAVATRAPDRNGLGMNPHRAKRWMDRYRAMFTLLPDSPVLIDRWQALVAQHQIKGFQVHDARYVAAMECLGISHFMTHNGRHFKDFHITLIDPAAV